MGKIKDTSRYEYDIIPSLDDYLVGSDSDSPGLATKSYRIRDIIDLIEGGMGSTDYISDVSLSGSALAFTSEGNAFSGNVELSGKFVTRDTSQTITGVKNFFNSTPTEPAIGVVGGVAMSGGYVSTNSSSVVLGYDSSDNNYYFQKFGTLNTGRFNFMDISANRQYDWPDASGTVALLSDIPSSSDFVTITGNQTISGTKTFSNAIVLDTIGGAASYSNVLVFEDNTGSNFSIINDPTQSELFFDQKMLSWRDGSGTNRGVRIDGTAATAIRTYTLPDKSGDVFIVPTGDTSFFIGDRAGELDDGTNNGNTGVGHDVLRSVTTSSNNTAIGDRALENTTGGQSTALGALALNSASTGSSNQAIGYQSLKNLTTGSFNIAIGVDALRQLTTGNYNIAIGVNAGDNDSSPEFKDNDYGILIGRSTNFSADATEQEIVIGGSSAVGRLTGNGSHTATIGDENLTDVFFGNGWQFSGDAAPSSASDTGTEGEIRKDSNYIYVCVATNTWKRAAISTW